ncbi:MAG: phosphoenolpyruvate carboxylase, partial [Acidobacteriia bacterium]|nr:phosphoenolpyruvate carboxylase [Terriglobia bacterium]
MGSPHPIPPPPEPTRARGLLDVELKKWDQDFRFLLGCFQNALAGIGEDDLARFVSESFEGGAGEPERFPARGSQALSVAFQLLNMAEENTTNQVRRMRETVHGPAGEPGSWSYEIEHLGRESFGEADLRRVLPQIHVEPVLTAHPTEAKRASVLERHREIYLMLVERENTTKTPMEQDSLRERIETAIERLWRTGEILLERPAVESEVRNTLHYLGHVFPGVLQLMSERFRQSWKRAYPGAEPPAEPRLTFGTWVGGDRDGHPFVTTEVTRYALEALHAEASLVMRQQLESLAERLSLTDSAQPAPPALRERIARYGQSVGDEPWRQWVHLMAARLPSGRGSETEPRPEGAVLSGAYQ